MTATPIPGNLDPNQCREEISIAYAHAIATAAQCSMEVQRVDRYGVDVVFRQDAHHAVWTDLSLDAQLKCTSSDVRRNDHIAYPLPVHNYNVLINPKSYNYKILIVMLVPPANPDWLNQSENALKVFKCADWISLRGKPMTRNKSSVTVRMPRSQVFSPHQLSMIFQSIGAGGVV